VPKPPYAPSIFQLTFCKLIASSGQTSIHAPQRMQSLWLIQMRGLLSSSVARVKPAMRPASS
jgi:hypothetical protein